MIVVAGPPGSGKTTYFPVSAFGVDSFNIDDRCAQILGSYRAISRDVRRAVAAECERFVLDHIARSVSFAVETTLRTSAAIGQATLAQANRFGTELLFLATDSVDETSRACFKEHKPVATLLPPPRSERFTRRAWQISRLRSPRSNACSSMTRPRRGPLLAWWRRRLQDAFPPPPLSKLARRSAHAQGMNP